jgi:Flp pilus assembly protein TadB
MVGHMSTPRHLSKEQRTLVWDRGVRSSFKLGVSVFFLALVIVIVGASTNSPPIVVGVSAGLIVGIFAFVFIFRERSAMKRELESKSKEYDSTE